MKNPIYRQDYYFDLPPERIAQFPPATRGDSRLLVLDERGQLADRHFADLLEYLRPGDLLVFNNTRVIPARLYGQKISGGKIEVMVERLLNGFEVLAHVRASKAPKPGQLLLLEGEFQVEVLGRQGALFWLKSHQAWPKIMDTSGHIPLPHYLHRPDQPLDRERYQTVYAEKPGAVAAPTAGLHFTPELLAQLHGRGVQQAFVTLHVGAGTFKPVQVDKIEEHQMHAEWLQLSPEVVAQVKDAKARGGRVIAVGSTSVRALETAAQSGQLQAFEGETQIFITPGYTFKVVDAMITNFHLPESTLIMMVSAFAGYEQTRAAYAHAIAQNYRFFSYGDAMLILGKSREI